MRRSTWQRTARFVTLLCWLVSSGAASAAVETSFPEVKPKISSGYVPAAGTDESEIWTSLEPVEKGIRHSPLLVKDEQLNDYVRSIVCRLDVQTCKDLRIYIVRNPNFNAMMYPNGMMVVWTGLLIRMEDEDQLAAVLGHELGHYLLQHGLQSWEKSKNASNAGMLVSLISAGAGAPIIGDLINLGILANLFKYSRDNEREADIFGVERMARAGYDPHEAARVWAYVEHEEQSAVYKKNEPALFRSHPVNQERYATLSRLAEQLASDQKRLPDRYWRVLTPHYIEFVDDQIDMNKPGRTVALLDQHGNYAVDQHLVNYAWGQFYSRLGSPASTEKAKESYRHALESNDIPSDVWRELGILEMKSDDDVDATTHLKQYLKLRPDAEDAAIVEFYLQTMNGKAQ